MIKAGSRAHLDQEELNKEDVKKLKIVGEWLSKKETTFTEPKDGLQKCVDSELRDKLEKLFATVEFMRKVDCSILTFELD